MVLLHTLTSTTFATTTLNVDLHHISLLNNEHVHSTTPKVTKQHGHPQMSRLRTCNFNSQPTKKKAIDRVTNVMMLGSIKPQALNRMLDHWSFDSTNSYVLIP